MPKESTLVRKIIQEVRAHFPRAYVRKIADRFTRGLPDIIIVLPCSPPPAYGAEWSLFLALECKSPAGRPTMIQRLEGEEINRIPGALWMVVRNVGEVLDVLRQNGAVK